MISAGTIGWDAYVWREGFDDWKPAQDIEELVQQIMNPGGAPAAGAEDPFSDQPTMMAGASSPAPAAKAAKRDAGADLFAQSSRSSSRRRRRRGRRRGRGRRRARAWVVAMTGARATASVLFYPTCRPSRPAVAAAVVARAPHRAASPRPCPRRATAGRGRSGRPTIQGRERDRPDRWRRFENPRLLLPDEPGEGGRPAQHRLAQRGPRLCARGAGRHRREAGASARRRQRYGDGGGDRRDRDPRRRGHLRLRVAEPAGSGGHGARSGGHQPHDAPPTTTVAAAPPPTTTVAAPEAATRAAGLGGRAPSRGPSGATGGVIVGTGSSALMSTAAAPRSHLPRRDQGVDGLNGSSASSSGGGDRSIDALLEGALGPSSARRGSTGSSSTASATPAPSGGGGDRRFPRRPAARTSSRR